MAEDKKPEAGAPGAPGADPASTNPPGTPGTNAPKDAPPAPAKAKPVKMLRIISKRDGFRRCGVAHSETATLYPLAQFTKEERAILEAERWLVVDEVLADPVTKEVL